MAYLMFNDGVNGIYTETPEKELRELLIEKTYSAGHMVTFDEARTDPTMVNPNLYAYYFGGCFTDYSESIWNFVSKIIKQEGPSMGKKLYNEETVKAALRAFYEKYHRWPDQTDIRASDNLPSYITIVKYCGKKPLWEKAVYGGKPPAAATTSGRVEVIDISPDMGGRAEGIRSIKVASTPKKEATAELTIDTTQANRTSIKLKVMFPDRKEPVLLHLSF